ncbi:MAG: hypothetical protein IPM66_20315 [Acidobacteriota bacterium]|nr:MAG: hypothetical protein IPM66_20315 [Acidobacteriota bacterium]
MKFLPTQNEILIAAYYCVVHLTPANIKNTVQMVKTFATRRRIRSRRAEAMLILAIVSSGLPVTALAQAEVIAAPKPEPNGAALTVEVQQLRREGTAALFNIDYKTAHGKFEEIKRLQPDHPAGDLYLATLIWLEHLYKSRRLQTSLYKSDSSFYAGADKAREETEGDAVDPATDRAFRDRMAQAKTKALALVSRNKKDPDALYFLGAVYGVMAGYEATVARKFFGALRNGSRGVDAHEKVLKLDPEYVDAYVSVGMYDYIVGNLPFGYRALVAIAGIRGNKQRGISRLEKITERETATADDVRVMLLAIYQNEKLYDKTLATLQNLIEKYPKNYLLKLELASTFITLEREEEAFRTFDELLNDATAAPVRDLVHFKYAESLAQKNRHRDAADQFIAASKLPSAEKGLATIALLRAAQVLDLAGSRQEAVGLYKEVAALPNVFDSQDRAKDGLKKPYQSRQ